MDNFSIFNKSFIILLLVTGIVSFSAGFFSEDIGNYFHVLNMRDACANHVAEACEDLYKETACEYFTAEECVDMMNE